MDAETLKQPNTISQALIWIILAAFGGTTVTGTLPIPTANAEVVALKEQVAKLEQQQEQLPTDLATAIKALRIKMQLDYYADQIFALESKGNLTATEQAVLTRFKGQQQQLIQEMD